MRRSRRNLIVLVAALLGLVVASAGCGSSGSNGTGGAVTTTAAGRSPGRHAATSQAGLIVPRTYAQTCDAEPQLCYCPDTSACRGSFPVADLGAGPPRTLAEDARCPVTRGRFVSLPGFAGVQLGRGPVSPIVLSAVPNGPKLARRGVLVFGPSGTPGWLGLKTLWYSRRSYGGPVLIRGRRLDGKGPLGFGEQPAELARMIPPRSAPSSNLVGGYRTWPGSSFIRRPGCYAFLVDGRGFSEEIVFEARVHQTS